MTALVCKELKSVFGSVAGILFSVAFLIVAGLFLWFFSGRYNIFDSGYADLGGFFSLAPALFIILIPAITMRLFADERRKGTLALLRTYPVRMGTVWLSKFIASFSMVGLTIISTGIYVYTIWQLGNPPGNIDAGNIVCSYIALLLLCAVFVAIGLFASATTSNQIVALVLAIVLSALSFYGFDLLAGLFYSGKAQAIISSVGLYSHYDSMQRGVVGLKDIFTVIIYIYVFYKLSSLFLNERRLRMGIVDSLFVVVLVLLLFIPNLRADFTSDKRYTISGYTHRLLQQVKDENKQFAVNVYLGGDLNPGFTRLKTATEELLHDFGLESGSVHVISVNPYQKFAAPDEVYTRMYEQDMPGITLNEVDREGKLSRKVIYPYAQVISEGDTLVVSLLKNIPGYTAEENLNASIESLEYEFADAIHIMNQQTPQSVAFIEGHGEIPRGNVYDAEEMLSKYFSVHRGQVGNQPGILDDFDVVVVAGPTQPYSEEEKFVLDQYIMSGGSVLWLVDGAYTSVQEVYEKGYAPSIKTNINLDDMLFAYGVRINPDFVQDKQCAPIMIVPDGDVSRTTKMPCYYMPLLMPSPDHIISRNIRDVKASFGSSLSFVNNGNGIQKAVLLTSSGNTHLAEVPEPVSFDVEEIQSQTGYFGQSYIPMAVALQGEFTSAFANRMMPEGVEVGDYKLRDKGEPGKMIVASSSRIIANDIIGTDDDRQVVPMGYDRVSNLQYGNPEFIVNAVNWLAGNDELMALRARQRQMYLLDKNKVYEKRDTYAALNIGLPVLPLLLVLGTISLYRRRRYAR